METKEFKRITKYDEFTVDEFVKAYNEAEENSKATIADIDNKIADVDAKIEELNNKNTRQMSPEEKESHRAEKEELRKEKSGYGKEKTQTKNSFTKYEKEKARIHERLSKDIAKIEAQIEAKKSEIKTYEDEIKANEEKLDNMDKKAPEYDELVLANRALERKITSSRGAITKYEAKIVLKKESQGNLEKNKYLGLKQNIKNEPRRENKKYKTKDERYREYLEKKAKETRYYAHARTTEESENFKKMDSFAKELKGINDVKMVAEIEQKRKREKAESEPAKVAEQKKKEVKPEPAKVVEKKKEEVKPESAKAEEKKVETKQKRNLLNKAKGYFDKLGKNIKGKIAIFKSKLRKDKLTPEKEEEKSETEKLQEDIRKSAERMKEYRESGNYNQEALERSYYTALVEKLNGLKEEKTGKTNEEIESSEVPEETEKPKEKRTLLNKAKGYFKKLGENLKGKVGILKSKLRRDKETPEEILEEKSETEKLEENIRKSAERMKEYRESGNYNQEALERSYYSELVEKLNELKEREKAEQVETVTRGEITKLEEDIRKSAERMREYKESGNYNQEALEHEYYNSLVHKMNDLKDKKIIEEPEIEERPVVKEEKNKRQPLLKRIKDFWGRMMQAINKEIDILELRLGITKALPESTGNKIVEEELSTTSTDKEFMSKAKKKIKEITTKISGYFKGNNETEVKEDNVKHNTFVEKVEVDEAKAIKAAEEKASASKELDETTK